VAVIDSPNTILNVEPGSIWERLDLDRNIWVPLSDYESSFDRLFASMTEDKEVSATIDKISSLIKLRAHDGAAALIVDVTEKMHTAYKASPSTKSLKILVNVLLKFSDFNAWHITKDAAWLRWIEAIDTVLFSESIAEPQKKIPLESIDKLAFCAGDVLTDLYYPKSADAGKYETVRKSIAERNPDIIPYSKTKSEIGKEQIIPDAELYEAAAKYLNESYNMFNLLMERGCGIDFARCLLTTYERLQTFCEIVGDKNNGSTCVNRVADIKERIAKLEKSDEAECVDSVAEQGIKTLLGLKVPDGGKYDAFLCHKREDLDIARRVYKHLKSRVKEVFLDAEVLPRLGQAEYRQAIMRALDHSDHFVVILSDLVYLDSDWVSEEMSTFRAEISEGRKKNANFLFIVTQNVMDRVRAENKKCIPIDYRKFEFILVSEFEEKLMDYVQ